MQEPETPDGQFRALFETMEEGVAFHELVLDARGQAVDYRITDVNPAFRTHTGIDPDAVRGHLATEVYGTVPPPFLDVYARVARGGGPARFETWHRPMERHFRISVVSPAPDTFATVFMDISDQKREESLLQARNRELQDFAWTVGHDLRGPLVTIMSFLELIPQDLQSRDMPRVLKALDHMGTASRRMDRLLEDILRLSRAGSTMEPWTGIRMGDLHSELSVVLDATLRARSARLACRDPELVFSGPRNRLFEVLQNLVENGAKHNDAPEGALITLGGQETGDGVVIRVEDNGPGIPEADRERIFGMFQRAGSRTEGSGLGLAIARRITEAWGGTLHAGPASGEAEGGRGSTFSVFLPRNPPDA